METAGKEDMPEDAERKGLGTPATRAGILEKLVSAGFLERKKSRKTVQLDDLISSHQVFQHGADPVQKLLWSKLPVLNFPQAVLPLGSQKRRLQLFRQNGDQGNCIVGREKTASAILQAGVRARN